MIDIGEYVVDQPSLANLTFGQPLPIEYARAPKSRDDHKQVEPRLNSLVQLETNWKLELAPPDQKAA